jgi:phenylalanyl-tRNA synthetase beta chain
LALPTERLTTLDGIERALPAGTTVVADGAGAVEVAGVMGGRDSAVSDTTEDVFLESAFFAPQALAGQARRHRLQTDSAYRFERGVDFNLQALALERATELLVSIGGGRAGPAIVRRADAHLPARRSIKLRAARLERMLGKCIPAEAVTDTLSRLGLDARYAEGEWQAQAPSFRFDLEIEADLVEEIARIGGYDEIPSLPPRGSLLLNATTESRIRLTRLRDVLVDRGYQEAITYSFVDPALQAQLEPDLASLALENAIASDMSVMRTSLWPGLIQALRYNLNRQCDRVRLFETGLIFVPGNGGLSQRRMIGGVITGLADPEQWATPRRHADFFDLKADVEALFALGGCRDTLEFTAGHHPALHPGQAAEVRLDGRLIGILGALHPRLVDELGVAQPVFVFQLELEAVVRRALPRFEPLSKFPTVRRDISVLLDRTLPAARIFACIAENAPEMLRDLQLFDLYEGEGIDPEKKSLTLGLIFQGTSSTLIDDDVDTLVDRVLSKLKQDVGAILRS